MGEYRAKNAQQQNGRNANDSQSGCDEHDGDDSPDNGLNGKWYVFHFTYFLKLFHLFLFVHFFCNFLLKFFKFIG